MQDYFEDDGEKLHVLPCRRPIIEYTDTLTACLADDLRCRTYLMAKQTELLYLIRWYYSKKELAALFRPMLGRDIQFRSMVFQFIKQGKNVNEMAEACHLSESGFRNKFKREFAQTPHQYIMTRKKAVILDAISNGTESFTRIALDNNMAGLNALDKFCREQFGQTPSEIRNK